MSTYKLAICTNIDCSNAQKFAEGHWFSEFVQTILNLALFRYLWCNWFCIVMSGSYLMLYGFDVETASTSVRLKIAMLETYNAQRI